VYRSQSLVVATLPDAPYVTCLLNRLRAYVIVQLTALLASIFYAIISVKISFD